MRTPCAAQCNTMHKAALRRSMLAIRKENASAAISAAVCEKAARLDAYKLAKTIMLYVPTGSELDTARLFALAMRDGKRICLPRVLTDTAMEAAWIGGGLKRGAFHIFEPCGARTEAIDLIFVPGVAFDIHHNRLGYGKGYYDRFLALYPDAVTVGLGYACQLIPEIPTESTDKPLSMILTEEDFLK